MFEFFLALVILTSGFMVLVGVLSVWKQLGPYFLGVSLTDVQMHRPMTTGVFLFLMGAFGVPWFLFHYVGVPCIRDTHQLCKEMRDCMLQVSAKLMELREEGEPASNRGFKGRSSASSVPIRGRGIPRPGDRSDSQD